MDKLPLPLVRIVQENLSSVPMFVFFRRPLERLLEEKFIGEWKYLRKIVFEISEERAVKACIELAIFLRALDDEEEISAYLNKTSGRHFGRVFETKGESSTPLKPREVTNKIIHASSFDWDFSNEDKSVLICHPRDRQRWHRAEVDIVALAAFCGELAG